MPECPFHRALGQGAAEPAGLDHVVDVVLDAGDRDQGGDLPGAVGLGRPGARLAARHGTARLRREQRRRGVDLHGVSVTPRAGAASAARRCPCRAHVHGVASESRHLKFPGAVTQSDGMAARSPSGECHAGLRGVVSRLVGSSDLISL